MTSAQLTDKEQVRRRRVLNLLEREWRTDSTRRQRDIRRLLSWQPGAMRIQRAGRCSNCKMNRLWSYQLAEFDTPVNRGKAETCGFYCGNCKWSNAGARPVKVGRE